MCKSLKEESKSNTKLEKMESEEFTTMSRLREGGGLKLVLCITYIDNIIKNSCNRNLQNIEISHGRYSLDIEYRQQLQIFRTKR